MNQPKFKMGDRIIYKRRLLTVKAIHFDHDTFFYGEDGNKDRMYIEEACELFEEPQKKKLYAFEHQGEIKFFKKESRIMLADRTPEYDIEYPEVLK